MHIRYFIRDQLGYHDSNSLFMDIYQHSGQILIKIVQKIFTNDIYWDKTLNQSIPTMSYRRWYGLITCHGTDMLNIWEADAQMSFNKSYDPISIVHGTPKSNDWLKKSGNSVIVQTY